MAIKVRTGILCGVLCDSPIVDQPYIVTGEWWSWSTLMPWVENIPENIRPNLDGKTAGAIIVVL